MRRQLIGLGVAALLARVPLALADSRQADDTTRQVAASATTAVEAPLGVALNTLVTPLAGGDVVLVHGGKALSRTLEVERLDGGLRRKWSSTFQLPEAKVDLKPTIVFRDGRPALAFVPDLELVPGMELQAAVVRDDRVLVFASVLSSAIALVVDSRTGEIDEVTLPVAPSSGGSLGFLVSPNGSAVALAALSDDQQTLDIHHLGPALGVDWHTTLAVEKPRPGTVRGLESLAIDDLGQVYVLAGGDDATVRVRRVAAGEERELSLATSERFLHDVRLVTRLVVPTPARTEPKSKSKGKKGKKPATPPAAPPRVDVAVVATAGQDRRKSRSLLHAQLDFASGAVQAGPSVLAVDLFGALDGAGWWALGQVEQLEGGDLLVAGQQVRGADRVTRDGSPDRVDAARGGHADTASWLGDIGVARLGADGSRRWTHRVQTRQAGTEGRLDLAGGARAWVGSGTFDLLHVDVGAFASSWHFDEIDLSTGAPVRSTNLAQENPASLAVRRLATRLPSGALLTAAVTADLLDPTLQLNRYEND